MKEAGVINQKGLEPSAFDPKFQAGTRMMTGRATTLLFRSLATLFAFLVLAGTADAQTLVWSEEFNYTAAPSNDVWSYDTGDWGWGNQELQNYTSDPDNVRVDGSNLVITAVRSGNSFTSARIKTLDKLTFKYGTVEARIQVPDLANGLWPAFWTLGNNFPSAGWPQCGEMDIMEMGIGGAIGNGVVNRRLGSHFHWDNNGGYANYGLTKDMPSDIDGTFVTYRMEWTPTSVTTYINGQWIVTMDTSSIPEFNQQHFFILNMAVGGTYTGIFDANGITAPFPAEYKVDWIRIYDEGDTVLGGSAAPSPPSGANLLVNSGIESGTTGWNLSGGSTFASAAYARSGTDSLKINSAGAAAWVSPSASQSFTASEGDIFNFQGYMLSSASSPITGGSFGLFKIEFKDSGGAKLVPASVSIGTLQSNPAYPGAESTPPLNAGSATDTWLFSETQAVAPAGTAQVDFFVLNVNEIENIMYFDDIQAIRVGDPIVVLPFSLSGSIGSENFQMSFPTQNGVSYEVAYKSSLTHASWTTIETIVGDGNTNSVSYPASAPTRFYRVLTP